MTMFAPAREVDAHPYWLPSEVRRRLVAQKSGQRSNVIREVDGEDNRQSVEFFRADMDGQGVHMEALAGVEAEAARDLFTALHSGAIDAFVQRGATQRLHPTYWEPRHDASTLSTTLLWGEDTISNHPDRPVPADYVGAAIMIPRGQAEAWIATFGRSATAGLRMNRDEREAELLRIAREFDAEGIVVREVTAGLIKERWPKFRGPPPAKRLVTPLMKGGKPGKKPGI